MNINASRLTLFFKTSPQFHLIHSATHLGADVETCDILGYLNPIHPFQLHVIGKNEIDYLGTLSDNEQIVLVKQLASQQALCLIFEEQHNIPLPFFQQNQLHIVVSQRAFQANFFQTLLDELNQHLTKCSTQNGAFVVVFGKGILITGKSGTGKSSLLLSLVKQGHLWVTDDASPFYRDTRGNVIGHTQKHLQEYVHIKGLGPINMDKTYGLACRIYSHPLDAVIHLSNNTAEANPQISAYTQEDTKMIFDMKFPLWHCLSTHPNLTLMVESRAKHLILRDWGYDSVIELENTLNKHF